MSQNTKQGVVQGAFILAVGTVIVKIIGALFKVPLMNILGGTGMSYFMTSYEIFNPIYALSVAGFPAAVSRMVSESVAQKRYRDAQKITKLASFLFLIVGIIGFCVLFFGSKLLSIAVGNPDAWLSVAMLAPVLLFSCVTSALRGYFQGVQNMYPTAISQIVEALAKLVLGIGLSYGTFTYLLGEFAEKGTVLGKTYVDMDAAKMAALPYASAAAVLGVSLSAVAATGYLLIRYKFFDRGIPREEFKRSPRAAGRKAIGKDLFKLALPICLGTFAVSLTSVIDLFTVMNSLEAAVLNGAEAINASVGLRLSANAIPAFLYGSYAGMAITLYNLVPALTTTFGISALPAVTASYVKRQKGKLRENVQAVFRMSAIIAMPLGLGISALAKPMLQLLYQNRADEVAAAVPALQILGIAAILLAFTAPIFSVLQAVGRADLPVKLMVIGGAMKLACNLLLVRVPALNLRGAAIGTLVCYAFIMVIATAALARATDVKLSLFSTLGKPLVAALLCTVGAVVSNNLLSAVWDSRLTVVAGIAVGGVVYLIALYGTGAMLEEDVRSLPGGQKLADRLYRKRKRV